MGGRGEASGPCPQDAYARLPPARSLLPRGQQRPLSLRSVRWLLLPGPGLSSETRLHGQPPTLGEAPHSAGSLPPAVGRPPTRLWGSRRSPTPRSPHCGSFWARAAAGEGRGARRPRRWDGRALDRCWVGLGLGRGPPSPSCRENRWAGGGRWQGTRPRSLDSWHEVPAWAAVSAAKGPSSSLRSAERSRLTSELGAKEASRGSRRSSQGPARARPGVFQGSFSSWTLQRIGGPTRNPEVGMKITLG